MPTSAAPFRRLLCLAGTEKKRLLAALPLTVAAAVLELLPYWILYRAIALTLLADDAPAASALYQLAAWLALALLGKYLCYTAAYALSHQAAYQLLAYLRQQLARRLSWLPLRDLQSFRSGELKRILLQDVEQLESFIAHHTVELLAALVTPLCVALLLFWTDWRLALAALATVPLAALASALPLRRMNAHFERYTRAEAALNATLVEYVRNMPVMKAFNQDVTRFEQLRQQLHDYYALIRVVTHKTVPGWSLFTVLLSANAFLILPLGAWLHSEGHIDLAGLMLAMMLGAGMLKPLLKLTQFFSDFQAVRTSLGRILPLLDAATVPPGPEEELPAPLNVELRAVSCAYGARQVLHTVDLQLPAGSVTALVGPSGAGKSTLVHLLGGLLQPSQGTITLNGIALDTLSDAQRCRLIGVATQEAFLFQGTLLENLRLARADASDEEVRQAARIAQADTFIQALPGGYDTELGERGLTLSGGERQRLAVARALLAATPILLLDEATAFADSLTERRFYRALHQAYPDKTILIVAHRMHAVSQADQIVVLADGRVQDCGRHQVLLQRNLLYRGMWRRHLAGENWRLHPHHAGSLAAPATAGR
ncbi:ABC transporter ATP-binding protein [Cupriavidus sp. 8B]